MSIDPTIVVSVIGGIVSLTAILLTAKLSRKAKIEEDSVNQIEGFQSSMLSRIDSQGERIDWLEQENIRLRTRFDALKNGMLSLSLFGTHSPISLWCKNAEGRRIYHNSAYEELTGVSIHEAAGKTDYEITGSKVLHNNWAILDKKVMSEKKPIMAIEKANHRDNPEVIFDVLSIKWPILVQNTSIGVEGAAIKVSEILQTIDIGELNVS